MQNILVTVLNPHGYHAKKQRAMHKDGNGPDPRFPVGNSPIRGRGWGQIDPHGDLNGEKFPPVGSGGDGDGGSIPVPDIRFPAPFSTGASDQDLSPPPWSMDLSSTSLLPTQYLAIWLFLFS